MTDLDQLMIDINTRTPDKLNSTNAVLLRIDDPMVHLMWCSGELPFKNTIAVFNAGDEPVVSWTARGLHDKFVGQVELHNNRFGWVVARLWVNEEWRRCGLARKLQTIAMDYAFQFTNAVKIFCDVRNAASWDLQTSMGFKTIHHWPEAQTSLRAVSRPDYDKYKLSVRLRLNPEALAPTHDEGHHQCAQ